MKFLKSLLAVVLLTTAAYAQQLQSLVPLSANTASNLFVGSYIVDNFIVINATTNNATLRFYDSSTTATNYVQAAYNSVTRYSTNFSTIFTNEAGVLVTNTFNGIWTAPVANNSATNTRPSVQILLIPAGTTLNKDVRIQVMRGLVAQANQDLTLLTTYRNP